MKLVVRIRIDGLKRKIAQVKSDLPRVAERALVKLAEEAIEEVATAGRKERESAIRRSLKRQFDAVFEEVHLKHVRPERWPDLATIYRARILERQRTFQGRKRFYVDERKADTLFAQLLARAMAHDVRDDYEVRFIRTAYQSRIEIVKRGRGRMPAVMIAYVNHALPAVAKEILRESFRGVKLLR